MEYVRVRSGRAQTFSYDAFGNITKTGSESFNPGYNYQTNQMASGANYDSNGDVLTDSLHSYSWDVEMRPTTIDGITVTYDTLGRMVEQDNSGSYTEIVFDCLGNKLALMNGASTLVEAFAPLPAGATAVYNASGLEYYRHPDWLGSSRFSSTPSRTMYNDLAYAPFGETYATSGSTGVTNVSFGGNNEDSTTNLYDAYHREYGIQGRWPSPDPSGIASVNPANPQSWNRYAYVLNDPTNYVDPSGFGPGPVVGSTGSRCRDASKWPCSMQSLGGLFAELAEGASGYYGDTFGCDPISGAAGDPSCAQALNWFVSPTWSPFYQNNASSNDPCVISIYDSNGNYSGTYATVDESEAECKKDGGQWVPAHVQFNVDANGIVQPNPQDMAAVDLGNALPFPDSMAQQYFSNGTCNFLKGTAAASLIIGRGWPASAPVTVPAGTISGLLALAGCKW